MEPGGRGSFQAVKLAKVRPDYRVQSLHEGHGRHAFHRQSSIVTILRTSDCPGVDGYKVGRKQTSGRYVLAGAVALRS